MLSERSRLRHRLLQILPQGIDHHVADEMDARRQDPLAQEVVARALLGGEQELRELVGEYAIDLLRHGTVEAAQSSFDVNYRDALFRRDQRTGDRGVDVA